MEEKKYELDQEEINRLLTGDLSENPEPDPFIDEMSEKLLQYRPQEVGEAFISLGARQQECILASIRQEYLYHLISGMGDDGLNNIISLIANMKIVTERMSIQAALVELVDRLSAADKREWVKKKEELLSNIYHSFADSTIREHIIKQLEKMGSSLMEELRSKLVNEDVIMACDDRSVQRWIREIENSDLAVILKHSDEKFQQKVLQNVSKRMKEMLLEEMEYIGGARKKDVEEIRQRAYLVFQRLIEAGEIVHPYSSYIL